MKTASDPVNPGKAAPEPKAGPMQLREMRIEIHRGPAPKRPVTGYTVHHEMQPRKAAKSGAYFERETHSHPFSADEHEAMTAHVADHLADAE